MGVRSVPVVEAKAHFSALLAEVGAGCEVRITRRGRTVAKSGQAIGEPLGGYQGAVLSAAFRAHGGRIVSAGRDGTVRLWDPAWGYPIRLVCRSLRDHRRLAAPVSDVQQEAKRTCERWGWR